MSSIELQSRHSTYKSVISDQANLLTLIIREDSKATVRSNPDIEIAVFPNEEGRPWLTKWRNYDDPHQDQRWQEFNILNVNFIPSGKPAQFGSAKIRFILMEDEKTRSSQWVFPTLKAPTNWLSLCGDDIDIYAYAKFPKPASCERDLILSKRVQSQFSHYRFCAQKTADQDLNEIPTYYSPDPIIYIPTIP